jgi:O-antigen/teichoic acid export membrane protein
MVASLIFGIVASRCLSKSDYATIRQTFLAYDFIAPVLMLGLPTALYYFLPKENINKKGVLIDNITLLIIAGLIFSIGLLFGGYRLIASQFENPTLLQTLPWLIPYPFIIMPTAGLAAVLVLKNKTKSLAIYNIVSSLTLTFAGIWAILATQSYLAPIIVRVFVPILFFPIALYLMIAGTPGSIRWPCKSTMLSMIDYSVPIGAATILGQLTLQLHSVIVSSICTPEEFAVYINGAIELPIVGIITGSIATVIFAEMSSQCAKGEKPAALELFRKASIKSACILFPTTCFFFVTATPFITLLYTEKYEASVTPFRIYLLILPIRIVVYGSALMALGLTRAILLRSLFDLLINALLCWVLVRTLGYIGAPIALALTLYLWTTPYNILKISKGFGVQWKKALPIKDLLAIFTLSVAALPLAILGVYAFHTTAIVSLCLAAALYWPFVLFFFYRLKIFSVPKLLQNYVPEVFRSKS